MPPLYPGQYQDQYPNQYPYNLPQHDQYHQHQYANAGQPQQIPAYSQIQISVPSRQQANVPPPPPPQQIQYNYHQNFQPNYAQPVNQYQYQHQYQSPSPYGPQYQHQSPIQQPMPQQHFYQNSPQYGTPQQRIQVNIPKPQARPQSQSQPKPQAHPQTQQRILKDVQPTVSRQQPSPLPSGPSKPQLPKEQVERSEPDYEILLLTLADEYLEAAQKLPVRSEEYFKLTATALGCIDAALNNFKLPPLREAQVSMRYAQLLFSETENYDDTERILTKITDLCERFKYYDLKYAAQLLLIRVLHQSRPKAALKDLQSILSDIEAYKHTAWEYAFRFQYVMFAATSDQFTDNHVAISQLQRICHVARQNGDNAVFAFGAVLEALIHLQSVGSESVQSSQEALAKARALQLNPDIEDNPQICIMMEFVDLCGQIKKCDTAQSEQKRKTMQAVLYDALSKTTWRSDGTMYLPITQTSLRGIQLQDGGLITDRNGKYCLVFSWLPKDEAEDLGYLFSGISAAYKNAGDGGKAEKFLDEGLGMIKEISDENRLLNHTGNVARTRHLVAQCHFLLEMTFLQCSKGQWKKAQTTLASIDDVIRSLQDRFAMEIKCLIKYFKGVIHQGQGDLEKALDIFQSPSFSLTSRPSDQAVGRSTNQLHKRDATVRDVSILAAMNSIFIIQQPQHPQHHSLQGLLASVDPIAGHHPNKNIQAAWNFVLASLPGNTILKTKQFLGSALNMAQSINNAQITTMCLVAMQEKFFKGVVGDQAIKCARAASHQARRLNEPMWIATASGLEADCLALHGMLEDSAKKREEMEKAVKVLPEKIKDHASIA